MLIGTTIIDYILSVCKDMNPKLTISRNYIVYKKSKNKSDEKHIMDLIKTNSYFKNEKEIDDYYSKKIIQIKNYWNDLKESDRISAFTDSDICRVIFKDVIQDDTNIIKEGNE